MVGIAGWVSYRASIGIDFNHATCRSFKVISHVICVRTDESDGFLQCVILRSNAVNKVLYTLRFTRNIGSDVGCTLTKIIKGLAMIGHVAL